jgi:hypothetical protein
MTPAVPLPPHGRVVSLHPREPSAMPETTAVPPLSLSPVEQEKHFRTYVRDCIHAGNYRQLHLLLDQEAFLAGRPQGGSGANLQICFVFP